jgi:hypothetical protein
MELQNLVDVFAAFGWQGLVMALIILVGVFIARKSGIAATGNHARIANIILSAVLFGLSDNPQSEGALGAIIASLLAGLAFELLKWLSNYRSKVI